MTEWKTSPPKTAHEETGFPVYLPALPHDRWTGISGYFAKTMFRHEKRLYKNMRRHQPYLAMLITTKKYSGSHSVTDNAVPPIQSESRVPPRSIRFPENQTEKQPYTVFPVKKTAGYGHVLSISCRGYTCEQDTDTGKNGRTGRYRGKKPGTVTSQTQHAGLHDSRQRDLPKLPSVSLYHKPKHTKRYLTGSDRQDYRYLPETTVFISGLRHVRQEAVQTSCHYIHWHPAGMPAGRNGAAWSYCRTG